jgi:UDP-glucose 4-epimerase
MKAFVTGGAGFIGSHIVRLLVEKGQEVVVFDNMSTGYMKNIEPFPSANLAKGDIRSIAELNEAMQGCSVVFHLAASIGNAKSIAFPNIDSEVNVIGTLNVIHAMRKNGVKTIIYSSSAGIFGEPQHLPVDEGHPTDPDSPYGVSKLAAEKHILCQSRIYGLRAVSLRYFNAYGVNQRYDAYGNVIPIFLKRILEGKRVTIFGDGQQTRDFVNVKDLAAANVAAAENSEARGVFNLGAGVAITISGLVERLRAVMPEHVSMAFGSPRPGDVRHSLADISRARQILGYSPLQNIEDGLREYADWFRSEMSSIA